jgi:cob(I)alamin adenosyltransferase
MSDRIYTTLPGGHRVAEDGARMEAYGAVDELNAFVGSARALAEALTDRNGRVWPLVPFLLRVQHELFNLASVLEAVDPAQTGITSTDVARLEQEIARTNHDLKAIHSFVLSGSGVLNGALHQCRAVCRRAERAAVSLSRQEPVPPEAVHYLNRLSDAFFAWSRWVSHVCGEDETLWDPHRPAV